jgi:DNA (cytosine-5)-methyltransferase 1
VRIGSLFSGAGGLDVAVERVFGATTAWHCEVDPAASKVLAAHWPGVPNLGDITVVDWTAVEPVDILCGGFPCQDISAAGRQAGMGAGTRSGLWSEFARAIDELRPSFVVIENVRNLLSVKANRAVEPATDDLGDDGDEPVLRGLGAVLGDLSDIGLDAEWATVSASSVGAPHRRERVFILATNTRYGAESERARPSRRKGGQRSPVGAVAGRGGDDTPTDATGERWPTGDEPRPHVVGNGSQLAHAGAHGRATTDAPRNRRPQGQPESAREFGRSDVGPGGDSAVSPVDLLPTPCAHQSGNTPENHLAKKPGRKVVTDLAILVENGLLETGGALLPTPAASDGAGGKTSRSGDRIDEPLLGGIARDFDGQWGKYAPAIARWENASRPAPAPTEPNKNGNPRLSAAFSEWLMGWPAGWVTDVPGVSRNDALRIVGNGVVPQQAEAALRYLLSVACEVVAS